MDRDERRAWFDQAIDFADLVSVDTKVGSFVVSTNDENIGGRLFINRRRAEFRVVQRVLGVLGSDVSDRVFIDCGANIATSTIPALRGGFAAGVAIEPEPYNFKLLRMNVILNGLEDRVTAVRAALSDTVGTTGLVVHPTGSGKHHVGRGKSAESQIKVPMTTVDTLVNDGVIDAAAAGLLWIDVQGHEAPVIRGATRLLDAGCPVLFEWQTDWVTKTGVLDEVRDRYPFFIDMRHDPTLTSRPMSEIDAFAETASLTDVLLHHATGRSVR